MTRPILPTRLGLECSRADELLSMSLPSGGGRAARIVQIDTEVRRTYEGAKNYSVAERDALRQSLLDAGVVGGMYLADAHDDPRDVAVGVAPGSVASFTLPTAGGEWRWYPMPETLHVTVDGEEVEIASLDVDARTFALSAAPTDGQVVRATYIGMRLVRSEDTPSFTDLGRAGSRVSLRLTEVADVAVVS